MILLLLKETVPLPAPLNESLDVMPPVPTFKVSALIVTSKSSFRILLSDIGELLKQFRDPQYC
ncbi:hypothetical protein D3C78_181770 [compost metagenome]